MTRYSVVHTRQFERELATLWIAAANSRAVTEASDRIDQLLAFDPDLKGDQIQGNLRKIAEGAIWVYYVVEPDDRRATLWPVRPAKP